MLLKFQLECCSVCGISVRLSAVLNWMDGQWLEKHMMPPPGSSIVCRVSEPLSVLKKQDHPESA